MDTLIEVVSLEDSTTVLPRGQRKVRKSKPNQTYSHCRGAREKLKAAHSAAHIPTLAQSLPGWQLKGASCKAWGCACRQFFPYLKDFPPGGEKVPSLSLPHHYLNMSTPDIFPLQVVPTLDFHPYPPRPPHPYSPLLVCIPSGAFLPVAAVQAVEAAGPDKAAAR